MTTVGVGGSYNWFFGQQADRNRTTSALGASLPASRLDPSFGLLLTDYAAARLPRGVAWRRSRHARPHRSLARRGFSAGVGGGLTLLESGKQLGQVTASAEALRLFELLPGHVLGIDVTSVATSASWSCAAS